ncbi:MAG: 16S rRNA (guanine(966)-N(2))-methyltransferase RsmD [Nitrospiraceae bacterium]|nr:MAG: 16S rRNA (guanine(966)-N(2))-methyltransferase RsmD [Nitrospiraceae bacterium]
MKSTVRRSKKGQSLNKSTRPTSNKVREALFNILRGTLEGTRFLDLYAGTGAVGMDALRQGAALVYFVETSKVQSNKIRESLLKYHLLDQSEVINKKVLTFIKWAEENALTFDTVFLDPPYHTDEIIQALSTIGYSSIVADKGIVVAEHFSKRQLPDRFATLHKTRTCQYGDTVLSFYEVNVGEE